MTDNKNIELPIKKEEKEEPSTLLRPLQIANQLSLKATVAKKKNALIFIILNDTVNLIRYDRALLWQMDTSEPTLLGISGESKINPHAPLPKKWKEWVKEIEDPARPQILQFSSTAEEGKKITMIWLPIFAHKKLSLGLWLELWGLDKKDAPPQEMINLMINYLIPSYGAAWERLSSSYHLQSLIKKKSMVSLVFLLLLLLGVFIKVPLRVIAPCEVVSKDPYLITAPLEGVIENVLVEPGQNVKKGEILFEYDQDVPLQELQIARKEVEILQSEVRRASTVGLEDSTARKELGILALKLDKEKARLDLAEYEASQLIVRSPIDGIVILKNPDEWRGKPVMIGEKILAVSNPQETKIHLWLPENDNIPIDTGSKIKIFLNTSPEVTRFAKLDYIAEESAINDKQTPSFLAEAEWISPKENVKLGLKGTAILYGEKVSLIYYIFRKPLNMLRYIFGI